MKERFYLKIICSCFAIIAYIIGAASCAENPYQSTYYGSNPFQPQYNFTVGQESTTPVVNPFQQPQIKFTLIGEGSTSVPIVTGTPVVTSTPASTSSGGSGGSTKRKCGNCVNGREKYQVYGGSAPDKYCSECMTTGYPHSHRQCTVCGGQGYY